MKLIGDIAINRLSGNGLKKHRQKKKILNLLYEHDTLSGPELSKRISVSLPTALSLLNELNELKFVEVRGAGESCGGRKPTMFGLSKNSIYVIACEIERYQGKINIYNSHNQSVTPIRYFETSIDDDDLADKIYVHAREMIEENNIDDDRILGIGVTMPGLIDEEKGNNHTIKNSEYRNVKERLEEKFDNLVFFLDLNHDTKMHVWVKTDKERISKSFSPKDPLKEYTMGLKGASEIQQIRIAFTTNKKGIGIINFRWIGLQNEELYQHYLSRFNDIDSSWNRYLKPDTFNLSFEPKYGIILTNDDIEYVRNKSEGYQQVVCRGQPNF